MKSEIRKTKEKQRCPQLFLLNSPLLSQYLLEEAEEKINKNIKDQNTIINQLDIIDIQNNPSMTAEYLLF